MSETMVVINKLKSVRKKLTSKPNRFRVVVAITALLLIMAVLMATELEINLKNFALASRKLPSPTMVVKSQLGKSSSQSTNTLPPSQNKTLATAKNLYVPFVLQAPFAVWDELHGDACEEASVTMAHGFKKGVQNYSQEQMDDRIKQIVAFEEKRFGYSKDTGAADTAIILNEFLGIKTTIKPVTTPEDIKKEITNNKIVIVPAWGKMLKNRYFRNGGPFYHMLVVKGFTTDGFITNDPGTKRGENYFYTTSTLFNAIHDWNDGDVPNGKKVMIVIE